MDWSPKISAKSSLIDEANLIRAKKILRNAYLSRHEGEAFNDEMANIYFNQATKIRPEDAQQALLKEVLKGDSKKIWHGKHFEDLTPEQQQLILPNMKNHAEKYLTSGEFDKCWVLRHKKIR